MMYVCLYMSGRTWHIVHRHRRQFELPDLWQIRTRNCLACRSICRRCVTTKGQCCNDP